MGTVETAVPLSNLVDQVEAGELELPEIQRTYVWNRPQVRDLLDSLYRGYPVGTILVWQSDEAPIARPLEVGGTGRNADFRRFLLDGQQRLTSLTLASKGSNSSLRLPFPDIFFNFETEEFQVANALIRRDPRWVSVTEVFKQGAIKVAMQRNLLERPDREVILERLNRLASVSKYLVPVHVLKGFTYEEVTDIFLRVNSRGTRLREAELAIARLAFRLPGFVTDRLKQFEDEIDAAGYDIDLRFLLRCLTAVATGQPAFPPLALVPEPEIVPAWDRTASAVRLFLNLLRNNLGIDSADWLPSLNALVVPVAYFARKSFGEIDAKKVLRWFLLASTWQRYAGSAETDLSRDLRALSNHEPFDDLIEIIRHSAGRLELSAQDLDDAGVSSPFFLATFLACRRLGATDWWSDIKLSSTKPLGQEHSIELHHIFPRALVSDIYPRQDVNELANMAFVSKRKNLEISANDPGSYLQSISPERLRQQYVPLDMDLWKVDRFQDFLAERRRLLAEGVNAVFRDLE
jgi:hypothetical protein